LHDLLRFCHLLLTIEYTGTNRVRTGGHRPQIETEFSQAIDGASPMMAFVNSIWNPADTPILTGRLTCHMTKCSREIGLAGEVECECNIDQGSIFSQQQSFGACETLRADVLMRRLTHGGLECPREMKPTQACN
jgi:hypothetical protein